MPPQQGAIDPNGALVIARHKAGPNVRLLQHHVLLGDVEDMLVKHLNICADWVYPMDSWTLQLTAKSYLDRSGVKCFRTTWQLGLG